jgi:hypothetical protein
MTAIHGPIRKTTAVSIPDMRTSREVRFACEGDSPVAAAKHVGFNRRLRMGVFESGH